MVNNPVIPECYLDRDNLQEKETEKIVPEFEDSENPQTTK
jgi:hypothetical protein